MPAPKLSPELQAKYTREYLDTLDRIDNLKVELKEVVTERKGEIATLDKAAFRLRRLLGGKTDDQLEVPGAEIPHPKPRATSMSVSIGGKEIARLQGEPEEIVERLERAGRGGKRKGGR
jgi:hypothetical protein